MMVNFDHFLYHRTSIKYLPFHVLTKCLCEIFLRRIQIYWVYLHVVNVWYCSSGKFRVCCWEGGGGGGKKTIHRQDSSMKLHFEIVPRQNWRHFADGWLFFYLSSLPVAHLSDASRRLLVIRGDGARR